MHRQRGKVCILWIKQTKERVHLVEAPVFGEDGGERNVVEDPALTAEYTTERTVVSIPRTRVPMETDLEWL